MARLPIPGHDSGTWGDILNEYLSQSLKSDGSIKDNSIGSAQLQTNSVTSDAIAPNSITNTALASDSVNATIIADGSITNGLIADGTIQEIKLSSAVQAKLNQTAPVTSVNTKTGLVILDKSDIGLGNVDDTSDATKNSAAVTLTNKTIVEPMIDVVMGPSGNTVLELWDGDSSSTSRIALDNWGYGPGVYATGGTGNLDLWLGPQGTGRVMLYDADNSGSVVLAAEGDGPPGDTNLNLVAEGSGVVQANGLPVATTTGTQTLSNKTITGGTLSNTTIVPQGGVVQIYNTADQTTNYERVRHYWNNNVYTIATEAAGTGTLRQLTVNGANTALSLSVNGAVLRRDNTTSPLFQVTSTSIQHASAVQVALTIDPTVAQSGTGGYTMLKINPTETATGSGTKLLIDAQVGGTSKFKVDNTGAITVAAVGTASGSLVSTDGTQTLTNKTISTPKVDNIKDTNGNTSIAFAAISNAVNYLTINNGPSGSPGAIGLYASGTDSNINLNLFSKGTGVVTLRDGNNTLILSAQSVASAVNYTKVLNAITGGTPTISAFSASDTNVSLALAGQGTGTVRLTSGATIPSSTSLTSYNTSDETTNYERVRQYWNSNVYAIQAEYGGTGTARPIRIISGNATFGINELTQSLVFTRNTPSVVSTLFDLTTSGTGLSGTGGSQYGVRIIPTINQSSTAGYTMLLINPTETATGSGTKLLADFQVSGVPKHTIDTAGITHFANTGAAYFHNQTDQATNYERVRMSFNNNTFWIISEKGGTGTQRPITIGNHGAIQLAASAQTLANGGSLRLIGGSAAVGYSMVVIDGGASGGTMTASSGLQYALGIQPNYNQSGTAGYTAQLINVTETATGSGTKNLLDLQVGGTSKTRIDNTGSHYLSSTASNGITMFNTSDETTNYERVRHGWSSNTYYIISENGGTGTLRSIQLNGAASFINLTGSGITMGRSNTSNTSIVTTSATFIASSGTQNMLSVTPTINQSGTASYTGLSVNVTETSTGSGTKLLADFQLGGTSKVSITSLGQLKLAAATTSAATMNIPTGTAPSSRIGGQLYQSR